METVNYELKSRPGIVVEVPADYAKEAEEFVQLAMEDIDKTAKFLDSHKYLRRPIVIDVGARLHEESIFDRDTSSLQDELYLTVCICGNEQNMKGAEKEKAAEIDKNLVRIVMDVKTGDL